MTLRHALHVFQQPARTNVPRQSATETGEESTYRSRMDGVEVQLSLDEYIARNFAARTEGLLRFAIELSLDATGVTEG